MRLSRLRVLTFLLGSLFIILFGQIAPPAVALLATALVIILFSILVFAHLKLKRSKKIFEIWLGIKRDHISRMKLDWESIPQQNYSSQQEHPFALDFDIIGEKSLARLIDSTNSKGGSNRLIQWLLTVNPDSDEIYSRQRLLSELNEMPRFRDRLSLAALVTKSGSAQKDEGAWIREWLKSSQTAESLKLPLIVSLILAPFTLILLGLAFLHVIPQVWILSLSLYLLIFILVQSRVAPIFSEAITIEKSLRKFRNVFLHFEQSNYAGAPNLSESCSAFTNSQNRPSDMIKRIQRVTTGASFRMNFLIWISLNLLMPWDLYFAYRLEKLKVDLVEDIPTWLDVWFDIEALCALATFAYTNPESITPKITIDQRKPILRARGLGHPLIPHEQRIENDFNTSELGELAIITGSNMSGKSTFLRTLGLNLVLAQTGANVLAQDFQSNLFRIFASIRVSDSVTNGISFFYAEVKRLKTLLTELENEDLLPVFYCIDEIFKGTNNRERLIGSRETIIHLIKHRGSGLIATHDLELVNLGEEIEQISNYHFRDDIKDGRMVFSYKIQVGPCPTTNALKIMALEGLPINPDLLGNIDGNNT
jgi:hypothetical protein